MRSGAGTFITTQVSVKIAAEAPPLQPAPAPPGNCAGPPRWPCNQTAERGVAVAATAVDARFGCRCAAARGPTPTADVGTRRLPSRTHLAGAGPSCVWQMLDVGTVVVGLNVKVPKWSQSTFDGARKTLQRLEKRRTDFDKSAKQSIAIPAFRQRVEETVGVTRSQDELCFDFPISGSKPKGVDKFIRSFGEKVRHAQAQPLRPRRRLRPHTPSHAPLAHSPLAVAALHAPRDEGGRRRRHELHGEAGR